MTSATHPPTGPVPARSTAVRFPVLAATAAEVTGPGRLVLVTHVLDTAVPYVEQLADVLDVAAVVPVPYSVRAGALARLERFDVTVPQSVDEVGPMALGAVVRAAADGVPVVLHDVGGYCADHLDALAALPALRGVVEDTRQGHWRYERRALPLPVYTIADSPLKALEDGQVGRAIVASLDALLRGSFFETVAERRVLVLGYGGIGTAAAEHLRRSGARVAVHDPDAVRGAAALLAGYRVGPRDELLSWADVVLGVSGRTALTADDLPLLRDGVVLASGSSKQVEFDVPGLRAAASAVAVDGHREELAVDGRTVFLLHGGHPVNFLHQSVLGSVLDLVYSELLLCTRALLEGGPTAGGLHRVAPEAQQALARRWLEHYGR